MRPYKLNIHVILCRITETISTETCHKVSFLNKMWKKSKFVQIKGSRENDQEILKILSAYGSEAF